MPDEGSRIEEEAFWFRFYLFDDAKLIEDHEVLGARALVMQQHVDEKMKGIACKHIWQHDKLEFQALQSGHQLPTSGQVFGEANVGAQETVPRDQSSGAASQKTGSLPEPACVGGSVRYGDNVEDEWVCIALLRALSATFTDMILALGDNDGQVLLIEAAEELPKWLEPDTSDHRVWMAGGKLQIVPHPKASPLAAQLPAEPTLREGLAIVRASVLQREGRGGHGVVDTEASPTIQSAIAKRMEGLPGRAVLEGAHVTRCVVPESVAWLLRERPQLLSAAVRCFYLREPSDLKAAARMSRFGKDRWVCRKVAFSRCLLAQLTKQQFFPPKHITLPPPSHPLFHAKERGVKLACAMEMLYQRDSSAKDEPACFEHGDGQLLGGCEESAARDAPEEREMRGREGEGWVRFKAALDKTGFFRGELQGSRLHRELEAKARGYFLSNMDATDRDDGQGLSRVMDSLLKNLSSGTLQDEEGAVDDDESWLNLNPSDLDSLLSKIEAERGRAAAEGDEGANKAEGGAQDGAEQAEMLQGLFNGMQDFVQKVSSYEGAEVPSTHAEPRNAGDHARSGANRDASESGHVGLDADKFFAILNMAVGGEESQAQLDNGDGDDEDEEEDEWDAEGEDEEGGARRPTQLSDETLDALSMDDLMRLMDSELASQPVAQQFVREGDEATTDPAPDGHQHIAEEGKEEAEDGEDLRPVDLELNLVQNILQSYKAQGGEAGPASNLYGVLGVKLPTDQQ